MYPYSHFLFTWLVGEVAVSLGYFTHFQALLVAILTLAIDIDHLIQHYRKRGNWNMREMWNVAVKGDYFYWSFIHRPTGFVLVTFLLLALSLFKPFWSLFLAILYYSHILLDIVGDLYCYRYLFKRKWIVELFGFRTKVLYGEMVFDLLVLIGLLLL